jgi:hypothetical protein
MMLQVKIGEETICLADAPMLRRPPKVGERFDVRKKGERCLEGVRLREVRDLAENGLLYILAKG